MLIVYLGTGIALVVYLIVAWIAAGLLHLDRSHFYMLFAILALLGIVASVLFLWFWKKTRGKDSGDKSRASGAGKKDEGGV